MNGKYRFFDAVKLDILCGKLKAIVLGRQRGAYFPLDWAASFVQGVEDGRGVLVLSKTMCSR